MNSFKIALLLLFLLFAGCVAKKQQTFVPRDVSGGQNSVVYVYRASQVSSLMLAPEVKIIDGSGEKIYIGKLKNGEYKQVDLKPGKYEVQIGAIDYYSPGKNSGFDIEPASTYYWRVDSSIKFETGVRYKSFDRSFSIQQVDAANAIDELAACVDVDSLPKEKPQVMVEEKKGLLSNDEDARFSTDKTADPFSRK